MKTQIIRVLIPAVSLLLASSVFAAKSAAPGTVPNAAPENYTFTISNGKNIVILDKKGNKLGALSASQNGIILNPGKTYQALIAIAGKKGVTKCNFATPDNSGKVKMVKSNCTSLTFTGPKTAIVK